MSQQIERAHPKFRHVPPPMPAPLGEFTAAEVRAITETASADGRRVVDLRGLGCPPAIAARAIARHAAKVGIRHVTTDAELRAKVAATAAQIEADKKAEREERERLLAIQDAF